MEAGKAEAAKRSVFALIDRKSSIDPFTAATGGDANSKAGAASMVTSAGVGGDDVTAASKGPGRIELKGLRFSYPARPENSVLNSVDLTIEPGA